MLYWVICIDDCDGFESHRRLQSLFDWSTFAKNSVLSPLHAGAFTPLFSVFLKVMQKTKKSIAKRFKITGTGKLMRRSPGTRHHLHQKTTKQKRTLGQDKHVSPGRKADLMRGLPHGLK
jgi:large subunit ribosomal protein L35|tara:strand:+ start:42 stop:398 length:357 start_codon:yes stop_codon:yes gene_type:complete